MRQERGSKRAEKGDRRWWGPLLGGYLFKVILLPTLAVGGIVFFALALERVLRLVQVVTRQGASANEAWGLIVYLVPHYLGLAVPAGFFFGVMLGIRKFHERSELVVMRSFGVPARRIFLPLGALAGALTLVMLVLTIWVQPHARHLFREHMNTILIRDVLGNLEPGAFLALGTGNVMRVQAMSPDAKSFDGFFMARQIEPGLRDYLSATTARVLANDTSSQEGELKLLLSDGILLREKEVDNVKSLSRQAAFQEMPLSIPTDNILEEPGPRGSDIRELTAFELPAGSTPGDTSTQPQRLAELHWRIIQVLSLPVLGALALPLALIGRGRSAKAGGLAVGLIVLVLFEKTTRLGKLMVESNLVSPWIGIWTPWLCLIVLALLAYRKFSGDINLPGHRFSVPPLTPGGS